MFYIKSKYPELIERYNIPLDEYPRRCVNQIAGWAKERDELKTVNIWIISAPGVRFLHYGIHR